MLVITETMNAPDALMLFRGEAPASEMVIRQKGINAKGAFLPGSTDFPSEALIRLQQQSFTIAALDAPAIVKHHVVNGGASPLLSFSSDRNVAVDYALHSGQRRSGLLLSIHVIFVQRISLQTAFNGMSSGFFLDNMGRRWIWVEGVRSMYPSPDRHVALGQRDSEYLLVGGLQPSEFLMQKVP